MSARHRIVYFLLAVLLFTRLLDVHFHLPPKTAGAVAHVVALALIEPHRHAGGPDHGHLAGHLYEGEGDEDQGAGLLAKVSSDVLWVVPVLMGLLLLTWRLSVALAPPQRASDSPPGPRRWALVVPPSQAPPLSL